VAFKILEGDSTEADKKRPSAAKRGYGHGWRKKRGDYLEKHPKCARCGAKAQHVHHKRRKGSGGSDGDKNLESLCQSCRSAETNEKDKKESMAVGFRSLVERVNDAAMVSAAEEAYQLLCSAVYREEGITLNSLTLKYPRGIMNGSPAAWCGSLFLLPPGYPALFGRDIHVHLFIPQVEQTQYVGLYDFDTHTIKLWLPTFAMPVEGGGVPEGTPYTDTFGRKELSKLGTFLASGHGYDVKTAFVHEIVHAMDDLRGVDASSALAGMTPGANPSYFENPIEVNARFIETLHHFERSMKYGAFGDPEWFGRSFGYTAQEFALLFYDYLSSSASNGYEYSEETRRSILSRAAGEYERLRIKMGV